MHDCNVMFRKGEIRDVLKHLPQPVFLLVARPGDARKESGEPNIAVKERPMDRPKPRRKQIQPLRRHVEFDVVPVANRSRNRSVLVADIHIAWDDECWKRKRVEIVSCEFILKLVRVAVAGQVVAVQQEFGIQRGHLVFDSNPALVDCWSKPVRARRSQVAVASVQEGPVRSRSLCLCHGILNQSRNQISGINESFRLFLNRALSCRLLIRGLQL